MKNWLFAAGLIVLTPCAALAAEHSNPAVPSIYTCDGNGVSRVALRDNTGSCCDGRMRCAQLLSTQVIVQSRHANRT